MAGQVRHLPTDLTITSRLDLIEARLKSGDGGGTSGGMDAWQTSVEKRLDSLDRRTTSIETGVSDVRERLSSVETKIDHLPSKGFTVTVTIAALTVLSLLVGVAANLDRILN